MPRFASPWQSFNGGELSPRMRGRFDLPAYTNGASQMENFIPRVQGPITRRSGTRYVAEVKDSDDLAVLIPFVVSTEASYIIEAGPLYFRFYTQEARLENPPGTPVEVVTPYTAAQIEDVRWAQSADVLYLVHPEHEPRKLERTTPTTFTLSLVDFQDGPYLDQNTDDTKELTASATTGSITITATGHTPFLSGRDEGRLVWIADQTASGYATITSVSSTTVVNADVVRDMPSLAAQERWRLGTFYVDNYPRTVTLHEQRLWFGGAPDSVQRLSGSITSDFERFSPLGGSEDAPQWSDTANLTNINAVSFELASDRLNAIEWMRVLRTLIMGTSDSVFNMRASSNIEAITPFNINVTEDDFTGANSVQPERFSNAILYLGRASRKLYSAAYTLDADGVQVAELTEFADHILCSGGTRLALAKDPHSMLYAVCSNGNLVSLTFEPGQRVAAWARHPIGGTWPGRTSAVVESIAVSTEPDQDQLWIVAKRKIDGATKRYVEFVEETFREIDPEQAIEDAFFVDSGLTFDGAATGDPNTIEGATQANPVVVTLTGHPYTDGQQVRITEVVGMDDLNQKSYLVASAAANTFALQDLSGVNVDGTGFGAYEEGGVVRLAATTLSGLDHLEGETVQILGDGSPRPDKTVASGSITLDDPAAQAQVGLAAPAVLLGLPREVSDPEGSSQGKAKAYNRATVRVLDTVGFRIGSSAANAVAAPFSLGQPMDFPIEPVTDDIRVTFPGGWDREGVVYLDKPDPLPATIAAVLLFGHSGAR